MSLVKAISPIAFRHSVDWLLFLALLPIIAAGLVTMYSFEKRDISCGNTGATETAVYDENACPTTGAVSSNLSFNKQLVWLLNPYRPKQE